MKYKIGLLIFENTPLKNNQNKKRHIFQNTILIELQYV